MEIKRWLMSFFGNGIPEEVSSGRPESPEERAGRLDQAVLRLRMAAGNSEILQEKPREKLLKFFPEENRAVLLSKEIWQNHRFIIWEVKGGEEGYLRVAALAKNFEFGEIVVVKYASSGTLKGSSRRQDGLKGLSPEKGDYNLTLLEKDLPPKIDMEATLSRLITECKQGRWGELELVPDWRK